MRSFRRSSSVLSSVSSPLFSSLLAGLVSAASLVAVGCSGGSSPTPAVETATSTDARDSQPNVAASDSAALETGNETFAFALYQQLARTGSTANVFFSPYSISLALSMTYAGAATTTATEIATALDFGLPQAQLSAAFDQLDLAITAAPAPNPTTLMGAQLVGRPFALKVASSLWAAKDLTFVPSFLDTLATDYGAPVRLADFSGDPEGARSEINGWVASETNDKIANLLPENAVSPDTKLALVDALYFDASWQTTFAAASDGKLTWNGAAGTAQVDSMSQENELAYGDANGVTALELPYVGGTTSMVILMPDAGATAPLTAAAYDAAIASLEPTELLLTMPKFSIAGATLSLKDELSTLGMAEVFTPAADFSALATTPLHIEDVLHQAFVHVDGDGTEAAAATAVTLAGGAVGPAGPTHITLDHPFTFVIRDVASGTILFAGYLAAP